MYSLKNYIILASLISLPFNLYNKYYSEQQVIENYNFNIIEAHTSSSSKNSDYVKFNFKNKKVILLGQTNNLKEIAMDKNLLKMAVLKVTMHKGLFESYVIKKWSIVI